MRKEETTNKKQGRKIHRMAPVAAPRKRGRPRKTEAKVLDQMNNSNEAPAIRFLKDLSNHDRTEIIAGADPNKVYRWCEESKIPTRESQGYARVTDPNVKTHFHGNFIQPEGSDTKRTNRGGMVLMEMPKEIHEWRVRRKDEIVDEQMQMADATMADAVRESRWAALSDDDEFVQETLNRG